MFVMRHKANSMTASHPTKTSKSEDVWFVDSSTSNHMMPHEDWFQDLRKPERPDYVETGDDTIHPNSTCRQCPIWGRRQSNLHQECLACSNNNEESGLSQRLWNKVCKVASTKEDASSKKKVDSSHAVSEKVGCSSSTLTR